MAVFTRRNALLGWSVVQSNRIRRLTKKARRRQPNRRRSSKAIVLAAASFAGALAFLRSRRSED